MDLDETLSGCAFTLLGADRIYACVVIYENDESSIDKVTQRLKIILEEYPAKKSNPYRSFRLVSPIIYESNKSDNYESLVLRVNSLKANGSPNALLLVKDKENLHVECSGKEGFYTIDALWPLYGIIR